MGAAAITFDPEAILRKRRAAARKPITWPFALAAAILMFIVGALTADPAALSRASEEGLGGGNAVGFALGVAIGTSLAYGAIAWAIVYFAFVRRRNPGAGLMHFGVIVGVTFLARVLVELAPVLGAVGQDPHQAEVARQGMVDAFRKAQSGAAAVDAKPAATGAAGVVEGFVRTELNGALQDHQAYVNEIRGTGFATLFTEASLGPDPNLARTERKLNDLADIVEKYRARAYAREAQVYADAQRLPMSDADRKAFMSGLDANHARQHADLVRLWDSEAAIIAEYQATARMLKAARGRWGFDSGKIMFARPADLNAFRAHLANIDRMAADEKAQQARVSAATLQGLAAPVH